MSEMLDHTKKFELKDHRGSPVMAVDPVDPFLERIFGHRVLRNHEKAVFPAYQPFLDIVLDDISKAFPNNEVEFGKYLNEYLDYAKEQKEKEQRGDLPSDFEFVTEPYEHQREGLVRTYYNRRWALFYDTGLGKTKVMCDLIRLLWSQYDPDKTALVLCPSHVAHTWKYEIHKHAGEHIDVKIMAKPGGQTPPSIKRKQIYMGKHKDQLKKGPYVDEYPLINYTGFDEKIPEDKYEKLKPHIEAYLEATKNDNKRERRNARNRITSRCKKWGFDYPDSARRLPDIRKAQDYDVVVMGYGVAKNDAEWIKKTIDYDPIICDESHKLRTPNSKRTKKVVELADMASRRYILTGTPSLGDPMDLWGQLRFLSEALVKDWYWYKQDYTVPSPYHDHMIVGYKNLDVLNDKVSRVSTRKKEEECLDLPEQRFIDVPVELDEDTKAAYNQIVQNNSLELDNGLVIEAEKGHRVQKLMQTLSGFVHKAKDAERKVEGLDVDTMLTTERKTYEFDKTPRLNTFTELLEDILKEERNHVIVWGTFTKELDMVEDVLKEKDVGYVRVDGSTEKPEKKRKYFKQHDDCRVYLSHCSISTGITLNKANYMIWYGLTYSLEHWEQAIDRNHRIGQDRPVTVYRLYTPNSLQEYIVNTLENKDEISMTLTDVRKCATCPYAEECRDKGIEPFDRECIYDSSQERVVTEVKKIP